MAKARLESRACLTASEFYHVNLELIMLQLLQDMYNTNPETLHWYFVLQLAGKSLFQLVMLVLVSHCHFWVSYCDEPMHVMAQCML